MPTFPHILLIASPRSIRYTLNFLISISVELLASVFGGSRVSSVGRASMSWKQWILLSVMGFLDVLGYMLNSMGFATCGAALST